MQWQWSETTNLQPTRDCLCLCLLFTIVSCTTKNCTTDHFRSCFEHKTKGSVRPLPLSETRASICRAAAFVPDVAFLCRGPLQMGPTYSKVPTATTEAILCKILFGAYFFLWAIGVAHQNRLPSCQLIRERERHFLDTICVAQLI